MKKYITIGLILIFSSCPLWASLSEGYNQAAGICLKKNWSVHLDGSFIYWHASQEGLNIAVTSPNSTFIGSKVAKIDFNYEPGFTFGFRVNHNPSGFDIYLNYTRLHFNNDQSAVGLLIPLWLHSNNDAILASNARSCWDFKLDLLDFEFARFYFVGKKLAFRTHFGLRGDLLDQTYNINYITNSTSVYSNNSSDSWAIGPRAGIDTMWYFSKGISMLANAAASLVYTKYKVSHSENDINNIQSTAFSFHNQDIKVLRPGLEMGMGLSWGTYFHQDKCHFSLSAKYDFQIMFNQNEMRAALDATGSATTALTDLYLHGLTLNIGFDF